MPPGQALTRKFPVVGEKTPDPRAPSASAWCLEVDGRVEVPLRLSLSDLEGFGRSEREVDLHCVTGWSRLGNRISGFPLAAVLAPARVEPAARFVRFVASSPRGHDTSLPLAVALADTWIVDRFDGELLSLEHGGPLRTVTPSRYFYKSLKWLSRIELLEDDRLGYWERESSYHNVGDPWAGDQRFTSGSIEPEELARFRATPSFAAWRTPRRVLLGLDLRDWRPRSVDLRGLQLKNCDLSGAQLANCDLRDSNLSLSVLRGADLRAARLAGADLEGCDFRGADLRDANLTETALSAARFGDARVAGMLWDGAQGLLESEEEWLRRAIRLR